MADKTAIEWTDATWNPITGCSVVSPGCTNCYAMKLAGSNRAIAAHPSRVGLTRPSAAGPVWTGEVRFNEQWLRQPLRWRRPRRIFVAAHSDLFHDNVPDDVIDQVFAVMAGAPQHQFQVLTKRPERMRAYLTAAGVGARIYARLNAIADQRQVADPDVSAANPDCWPLPNVWLGVSVEDQVRANQRIPLLLDTPAAVRWLSMEPLLGPVDLTSVAVGQRKDGVRANSLTGDTHDDLGERGEGWSGLNWIVLGGESGPGARPMHPDWARSLRDQCAGADVPFLFKQWGDWLGGGPGHFQVSDCRNLKNWGDGRHSVLIGKRRAGRQLDGRHHDGFPA